MFSENDMEDAIAKDPKKYIGESGLQLLARQHREGSYIFDLLFVDKYGGKLIVEIQKGTLDRNHTYKILDYYDEYKEKNPNEFIELMVIANKIPLERKKRLKSWGITFKEIPENKFVNSKEKSNNLDERKNYREINKEELPGDKMENSDYQLYRLFDRQRNLFVDELRKYDPSVKVILNWKKLEESNIKKRKNWFTCFIPKKCGKPKKGFGIHFGFVYQRDRKTRNDYVRLIVGTEKPLDPSFNNQFKNEVVEEIKKSDIDLRNIALYPNAGERKSGKLL